MKLKRIKLERDGPIAKLILNRPDKMNAIDDLMLDEFQAIFTDLDSDSSVRAVVITGAGNAFSSGFDISIREKPLTTVQDWRQVTQKRNDTWLKVWRSRLPVIAAVNGYCLGGACELAMACDITLAGESATFGEPEIQFQSAPPFMIMPWVIGLKATKELLLTGDRISSHEAKEIGMINRVVKDSELIDLANKFARKLTLVPQEAMYMNKLALNRSYEIRGFQSTIDYGAEMFNLLHMAGSEERKQFFDIGARDGMKAAFKWRDERYSK